MSSEAAVVTGASAGIGEAIVASLLERGLSVVTLQRSPPRMQHPKLHFRAVDLTDLASARSLGDEIARDFPVRYLVNNAGANCPASLDDATIADLEYVNAITLGASMVLTQAFVPGMRRAKFGRIVSISSRAILGKRGRTVYSAAKAGLIGMTRTIAVEVGAHGITANTVVPGPVATEHFDRGHPHGSAQRRAVIDGILVGRIGTSQDVARAVMFLLHPDSGFITGQALFVCGGTSVTGTGGD